MSNLDELAVERQRVEVALRQCSDELAGSERRHDEVLVLVAERAQVQKDAALEAERSGGGDSKALTRAVAGHQEAQARLDALVEVIGEKRSAVETAQLALSAAVRAEAEERARSRSRRRPVRGDHEGGPGRLRAAQPRGRKVGNRDSRARAARPERRARGRGAGRERRAASGPLRRGAVGIGEASGEPHALVVPAAAMSPKIVSAGRAVVTAAELVARMQRTEPEQAA